MPRITHVLVVGGALCIGRQAITIDIPQATGLELRFENPIEIPYDGDLQFVYVRWLVGRNIVENGRRNPKIVASRRFSVEATVGKSDIARNRFSDDSIQIATMSQIMRDNAFIRAAIDFPERKKYDCVIGYFRNMAFEVSLVGIYSTIR